MRKQQRKAADGSGDPTSFAKVVDVNKAFQELAKSVEGIASTMNQNMGAIRTAFSMADAHTMTQRRILNDMMKKEVQLDASGDIDWTWYHLNYNAVIGFCMFVAALKEAFPDMETPALEEASPVQDDFEFGGDQPAPLVTL